MTDADDHGAPVIRVIEEESVRRIVAGQAVTDLASAVKELVDNSLDANSRSINIRLFNQGVDIVEVTDDGCGVPPASRPYMATPHATSKIRCFEDIYRDDVPITTLGFRGEALFCLANLSEKLMIATRTAEEPMAQKMEFRRDGTMDPDATTQMHRKVGTTVAVMKLLSAVPVRRADMKRRIQRQRGKLLRMMEGYAIFSVGVRINLMDMVESGGSYREHPMLTTSLSSNSVEENISSVMGSRFFSELSRFTVDLSTCYDNTEKDTLGETEEEPPQLLGFISSAKPQGSLKLPRQHGGGNQRVRNAQFFSINERPVELPQISRALNDAWRPFAPSADTKKKPSCVFCFRLPNSSYDINLSPEKRQVLLTKEKEVCQLIREAVTQHWASESDGRFTQNDELPVLVGAGNKRPADSMERHGDEDAELFKMSPESRKRHRRRYAFVHDFNKAKMQHEHEDYLGKKKTVKSRGPVDQGGREEKSDVTSTQSSTAPVGMGNKSTTEISSVQPNSLNESQTPTNSECSQILSSSLLNKTEHPLPLNPNTKQIAFSRSARAHTGNTSVESNQIYSKYEQYKVSPMMTRDARSQISQARPTKGLGTTIRKVSNDKFPTTQDDTVSEEPKTITPLNEKLVVDPLSSEQSRETSTVETNLQETSSTQREFISDRVSDAERRGWNSIQSRFNQSYAREDDIEALLNNSRSSLSNEISLDPVSRRIMSSADTTTTTKGQRQNLNSSISGGQSNVKTKNGMLNLEQFAFRRVSNDNVVGSSVSHLERNGSLTGRRGVDQSNKSCTKSSATTSSRLRSDEGESTMDSNNDRPLVQTAAHLSNSEPRKMVSEKSEPPIRSAKKRKIISQSESPVAKDSEEFVSSQSNLQQQHQQNQQKPQQREKRQQQQSQSQSQTQQESEEKTNHVCWESFKGTNDIVRLSRRERIKMREYRRTLRGQRTDSNLDDVDNDIVNRVQKDTREVNPGTTITLSKGKFSEMTIIGQFNLGFILAKCPNNHLWILDQHACDEKYNLEHLVAHTVFHEQKLIAPMPLELSPAEETCILDHMDIFEKNGFRFSYDPNKEARHRLALTALPHSGACDGRKAVQFGKEDVAALCAILGADGSCSSYADSGLAGGTGIDGNGLYGNNAVRRYAGLGVMSGAGSNHPPNSKSGNNNVDTVDKIITRLPKAIAMFASRACRRSIMIGTALSHKEMEKLLKKMDDVEQPWTCAHGRPTMSHVSDLHPRLLQESTIDSEHVAGPTITLLTQTQQPCDDDGVVVDDNNDDGHCLHVSL